MRNFPNILLLFLLFGISLQAQIHNVYIGSGSSSISLSSTGEANPAGFNDLYVNPEWKLGSIVTKENSLIQNLGLRFNVSAGQFEMVTLVNPDRVKRVNLDGKIYVYTQFLKGEGKVAEGYFQLLTEGKTRLLLQRKVERKAGKKGLYGYEPFQTILERYFLQKGDHPAVEVKRTKKAIMEQLSDKKQALEAFIKDKNLNLYHVKDIGILLKYYNTLSK